METAFQQLVNGLSLGSTYAVFAMGFTLIFGVLNILNMAQGSIFMAGAYFGLEAGKLGLPGPLALLVSIVGAGFLSVVAELLVFRQLRRRGAHRWMGLVASLALARMTTVPPCLVREARIGIPVILCSASKCIHTAEIETKSKSSRRFTILAR